MHMLHMESPIKILRPFNVFGETQSNKAVIPELIEKFIKNKEVRITKGLQTREFNYVGTVALIHQALKENFFNQVTNISDWNEIKIKSLAKKIKKISNSNSKIIIGGIPERPTEIKKMKASEIKMKKLFSKKYTIISFDEGLKRTIDWHKKRDNLKLIF